VNAIERMTADERAIFVRCLASAALARALKELQLEAETTNARREGRASTKEADTTWTSTVYTRAR
jgi:hypothetical protein